MSRAIGKTVREAQARAYRGGAPHPLAGRLLPPRHRLAGGGAGNEIMADLADLYPGYASRWIDTAAGKIFARVGGRRQAAAVCCCTAIRKAM